MRVAGVSPDRGTVSVYAVGLSGDRREDADERCSGQPGPQAVTATAARGLSRFAQARGIPAGAEFLLDYDVIEAFCVAGLAGRAYSTRGTCRSALYWLAAPVHGEPGQRGTPFAGARPPAPYSPAERAGLAAIAAAQRDPARRPPRWPWWYSESGPGCGQRN